MKEYLNTILIIATIIICFIVFNQCDNSNDSTIISTHKDSTIVYLKDTNTHTHTTNNIYTNPIFTVNPGTYVDTQKIIKMYFTKYFATDTLRDTLINLVVNDTLFNNKITSRKYSYKLIKPYQVIKSYTVTNTINQSKGFYVGAFTGFNKTVNVFGINGLYIKNKNVFGAGYDFLNKNIQLNYAYKIK